MFCAAVVKSGQTVEGCGWVMFHAEVIYRNLLTEFPLFGYVKLDFSALRNNTGENVNDDISTEFMG